MKHSPVSTDCIDRTNGRLKRPPMLVPLVTFRTNVFPSTHVVANFLPSESLPADVGVFQRWICQHPMLRTMLQASNMDQHQAIPQVPHFGTFLGHHGIPCQHRNHHFRRVRTNICNLSSMEHGHSKHSHGNGTCPQHFPSKSSEEEVSANAAILEQIPTFSMQYEYLMFALQTKVCV
ncbi:hypothetical protein Trydic_g21624 [Trypoxylus dichotomus]